MKNLKRALSLVLSTAMLVGMMVVGTGAAHKDVTAEHNEEAIAVVSAAGIMGANENFEPNANITRNEMAVVMCNMLGLKASDYAGASKFTDVPDWAKAYVDACYAEGIVSGVSATEYNGSANVTTVEASLMMLKALGYFEEAKLNDWMLDTIKMASKIELLDGIDAKATAKLTRNEVAQLALNTLEATCVEETATGSTTSVKGDGFEITTDALVVRNDKADTKNYNYNTKADGKLQLIEKLYKKRFTKTTGNTDLGQPTQVWKDTDKKTSEQEIVVVVDAPAQSVLVKKTGLTTELAVYNEYVDKKAVATDVFATSYTVSLNGGAAPVAYNQGDVVEYYTDDNGKVTDVAVIRYSLGKITSISTNLTKDEKEDGNTCKVTLKTVNAAGSTGATVGTFVDSEFAGFKYEKDTYVLYVYDSTLDEIVASKAVETFTGKVEKTVGTDKVVVNGETYTVSGVTLTLGDQGTFYLNAAGQIFAADTTAAKSSDYAYIYSVVDKTTDRNEAGLVDGRFIAYMILEDGTQVSYPIAKTADEPANALINTTSFEGVIAYAIDDGELVVKTAANYIDTVATTDSVNKNDAKLGNYYVNADTEFIFVDKQSTKVKTSVVTGYKNVAATASSTNPIFTVVKDNKILTAFVTGTNNVASDSVYAVRLDTEYTQEKIDGKIYTTINVSVDGEKTTLTFKGDTEATKAKALKKGELFSYKMVDGYAEYQSTAAVMATTDKSFEVSANKVAVSTADYIVVGGAEKALNDKVKFYTVTVEFDSTSRTKIESVSVAEGATIEKDDYVAIIMDGTDVDSVYVLEVIE